MLEENVKILFLDFAHIYFLFSLTPIRKKIEEQRGFKALFLEMENFT